MKIIAKARKLNKMFILMLFVVFLCGCQNADVSTQEKPIITGFVKPEVGTYDSIDTAAVVLSVDKEKQTVTFYNRDVNRNYTLSYDGTCKIYDKYDSSIVIDQINAGDVVDLTFTKSKKLLNSLNKSKEAWVYEDVDNFVIDSLSGSMTINGGEYQFSNSLKIFSEGLSAQLIDINNCDKLIISGVDHTIYSIVIGQGHGYLRLKGQDLFVGGWIEISSKMIKTITEDMLVAVPVGNYDVKLSKNQYEGSRSVTIKKNQETELDVSDMVEVEEVKNGTIVLVMTPTEASVYIDGNLKDTTKPLSLEYGIHQIIAKAEGYKTLTQYIKVAQENATLDIEMEKVKDKKDIDGEVATPTPTPTEEVEKEVAEAENPLDKANYQVSIESPEGAEIYLDGAYVGVSPVSFKKKEGVHVVTLRKEGYVTRSYTITLDGLLQNESFSFSSLEKSEENTDENTEEP